MPAKVYACRVFGLTCELVQVEADIISSNIASFHIVGLGDTAVQEAKERVRAAIKNSGCRLPWRRKVVNLAPADMRKQGPSFDLSIAMSLLLASEQIDSPVFLDSIFIGELSLEGVLRPVTGVLSMAGFTREKAFKRLFLPEANAFEASLIPDIEVIPVKTLSQLLAHLRGEVIISPFIRQPITNFAVTYPSSLDMQYVKGQEFAKRALKIAAAGSHNVLFNGPPGSGKTILARTFQTILPDLTLEESLEVTKIYSIAGLLPADQPLIHKRPFRSVHHTASAASVVGGGKIPKPGEISLAHKGVLFLDEIAEFPATVLESLRQPLEDRIITIGRASGTLTFPAQVTLIAAMNPCPCGYATDPEKQCTCNPQQVKRYQKKLSGPLLDRIDLQVEVPRLKFEKLTSDQPGETSAVMKEQVMQARIRQRERFSGLEIQTNSEMGSEEVKKFCNLKSDSLDLLKQAVTELQLSARSFYRILKTARTIADLEGKDNVELAQVAEALQYRRRQEE